MGALVDPLVGSSVALRSCLRGRVMVAKSFVMMVLATLLGPAVGIGLFVLMHAM